MSDPIGAVRACPLRLGEGERWFVVHTLPKKEPLALLNLARQEFRAFSPMIQRTVRHARRSRQVREAFFPRYIFVVLDLERDRWRSVNGTFGVASLIMERDRPKPVPNEVVESLIEATGETGLFEPCEPLAVGDGVHILTGPFAARIGTIARLSGAGRVSVLLDILGAERAVTLSRKQLLRVA